MPTQETFQLPLPNGRLLNGLIDLPDEPGPRPTIVDCHGFKAFMEWGFHPYLAELLTDRGFGVVRFNFTSSGMQPGDDLVTDEEAFASATFGDDVYEIQHILGALEGGSIGRGRVDADRIGVLGHSRGGGTSILALSREPWIHRVKALVTWAAIGTVNRVDSKGIAHWRETGGLPVVNGRTGQVLRLDRSVLEDGEKRQDEYDVGAAATRIKAPWLILHGTLDETVPVHEGEQLAKAATCEKELHAIEGAGHTFGAQHPLAAPNPHLTEVLNATQTWMRRYL